MRTKTTILFPILTIVLFLDILSKRWAEDFLRSEGPISLLEGFLPLTHAYNRGAAFGLSIGNDPRWFFIPVTILAMCVLGVLLVRTEPRDRFRLFALSLVFSGALGNLIDRVRWNRGVVDFIGPIDLPFTTWNWPIFNVADMAISCGAIALAISFWMEESGENPTRSELAVEGDAGTGT